MFGFWQHGWVFGSYLQVLYLTDWLCKMIHKSLRFAGLVLWRHSPACEGHVVCSVVCKSLTLAHVLHRYSIRPLAS
jgi:hypothetical protein